MRLNHTSEGWALYLEAMRDWPKAPAYVCATQGGDQRRKRTKKRAE